MIPKISTNADLYDVAARLSVTAHRNPFHGLRSAGRLTALKLIWEFHRENGINLYDDKIYGDSRKETKS